MVIHNPDPLSYATEGRTREAPQAGGAHSNHNAEVTLAVGIEEQQHGGAAAEREAVP